MPEKTIYLNNHKYHLIDEYYNSEEAYETAKKWKKERKIKYYVMKVERGTILPETVYLLYSNKKIKLW